MADDKLEEGEANLAGRPQYQPTPADRTIVKLSAAIGIPHDEIAKHLNNGDGIAAKTLRKHFRQELDHGMYEANLSIAGKLFEMANNCPDLSVRFRAASFWAERRMGWSQTVNQQHSGPAGGPIQYQITDQPIMTDDEWAAEHVTERIGDGSRGSPAGGCIGGARPIERK